MFLNVPVSALCDLTWHEISIIGLMLIRIWCTLKISRISRPSTSLSAITIQAPLQGGALSWGVNARTWNKICRPSRERKAMWVCGFWIWVWDWGTQRLLQLQPPRTIPISYVANVAHMHYINPVWAKGWGLLSTCPGLKPKWNGGMKISHIPGRPHTSFPPPVLVRRVVFFFFFFALIKCVMRLEFIN